MCKVSWLLYVLIPLNACRTIVAGQLDKEVLCGKEWFQFHLNGDVFGLGILVDTLEIVVLDELAWPLIITQEIMDCLL